MLAKVILRQFVPINKPLDPFWTISIVSPFKSDYVDGRMLTKSTEMFAPFCFCFFFFVFLDLANKYSYIWLETVVNNWRWEVICICWWNIVDHHCLTVFSQSWNYTTKTYHGTLYINKTKNKQYHTVGTILK